MHGRQITHFNNLIQWLGKRYGLTAPSCTQLRKAGATEVALKCVEAEHHLLASQMSHSRAVHQNHYEMVQGSKMAAKAHTVRQRLAETSGSEPDNAPEASADKQPRKKYSDNEEAMIKKYFRKNIRVRHPAKPYEAKAFLKAHPIDRSFKQIQDRVRQPIG